MGVKPNVFSSRKNPYYRFWKYISNSTRKSGYNKYKGWTQTDYQNEHYNINEKDEET